MSSFLQVDPPISLQCRFSYLFVSGAPSPIELVVTSNSAAVIDDLRVDFVSTAFAAGRVTWRAGRALEPWARTDLQILNGRGGPYGNHPVKIEVSLRLGGRYIKGRGQVLPLGQPVLVVFSPPKNVQTLMVEIKERAFLGAILENVDVARLQHVNDLLGRRVTEQFDCVALDFEAAGHAEHTPPRAPMRPNDSHWPAALGRWLAIEGTESFMMATPVPQGVWKEIYGETWPEYYARAPDVKTELSADLCDDLMPVVGITFAEAVEFCNAYQIHCQSQGLLPEGWTVRLPLAAEWRKARGDTPSHQELGRYCHNHGISRHTRSGQMARPRSVKEMMCAQAGIHPLPSGFYGMLGDLFEWCLPAPLNREKLPSHGMLLGGSWKHTDRPFCTGDSMNRQPVGKRSRRFGLRFLAVCEQPWHQGI